ncbi:hypothetical protein N752_05700 [Desulforamulus aquiferis]|nr:hypothetical protein N752_05700 [Desulforamulus aquiferis]
MVIQVLQVADAGIQNDKTMYMDVTPIHVKGRVCLPAKYVAEVFGYEVSFDANTNTAFLRGSTSIDTTNPPIQTPAPKPEAVSQISGWTTITDTTFGYSLLMPQCLLWNKLKWIYPVLISKAI